MSFRAICSAVCLMNILYDCSLSRVLSPSLSFSFPILQRLERDIAESNVRRMVEAQAAEQDMLNKPETDNDSGKETTV